MKSILFLTLLLLGVLNLQAQINSKNQDKGPVYEFNQEYSFAPETSGDFSLIEPHKLKSKGLLDNTPWVQNGLYPLMTPQYHMHILHPELDGYQMPVDTPDPDVEYSLLIFPPVLLKSIN